jgi:hypothetical protein
MRDVLALLGAGLALLIALYVYRALWPWKCPRCGVRALLCVGTAGIYRAPEESPWEIRFLVARCGVCGQHAYRRARGTGAWETEMRVEPERPPLPPLRLPAVGGAPEIVFDDAVPPNNQSSSHE